MASKKSKTRNLKRGSRKKKRAKPRQKSSYQSKAFVKAKYVDFDAEAFKASLIGLQGERRLEKIREFERRKWGYSLDDLFPKPPNIKGKVPIPKFSGRYVKQIGKISGYAAGNVYCKYDPSAIRSMRNISPEILYSFKNTRRARGESSILLHRLKLYDSADRPALSDALWDEVISDCKIAFQGDGPKCRVKDIEFEGVDRIADPANGLEDDKSPGFPFLGGKYKPRVRQGEAMEWALRDARYRRKQLVKVPPGIVKAPPCVVATRPGFVKHEKEHVFESENARLVWVYPISVKVSEAQYAQPLLQKFKKDRSCPMWIGPNMQREIPPYINYLFKYEDETTYGLDFSKFDSSIPAWVIEASFDVLASCIDWESPVKKSRGDVAPNRYEISKRKKSWEFLKRYFIRTPILFPDGRLYRKSRGVPSGSYFTSMIDSVANWIMTQYTMRRRMGNVVRALMTCGDDNAFTLPDRALVGPPHDRVVVHAPTGLEVESDYKRLFGIKVNGDKSTVTKDPTEMSFLGHYYRGSRCFRPEKELFRAMLFPERMVGGLRNSVARALGILLDSALQNPIFYDFVRRHITLAQMSEAFYREDEGHGEFITDVNNFGLHKEKRRTIGMALGLDKQEIDKISLPLYPDRTIVIAC